MVDQAADDETRQKQWELNMVARKSNTEIDRTPEIQILLLHRGGNRGGFKYLHKSNMPLSAAQPSAKLVLH